MNDTQVETSNKYDMTEKEFVGEVLELLNDAKSEISDRNGRIARLDSMIYGDGLTQNVTLPFGHDLTKANWLRRVVEIHTEQFMGNGFSISSTYNTKDPESVAPQDKPRIETENRKSKEYADQRRRAIENAIDDNGGMILFKELAANCSATGTSVVKSFYDEKNKKWVISQIESVENVYAVWSSNDFRQVDGIAYVYQISETSAAKDYGVTDAPTSALGQPIISEDNSTPTTVSTQKMVTVIEYTGYVEEYKVDGNRLKKVKEGDEEELNVLIVGGKVKRLIGAKKKLPKYYILPNKRHRRRPWGVADISEAAIDINLTYIETLSDWRTVSSKVNFPKFKALGMGPDIVIPKPKERTVEIIPLSEGQDIQLIDQGDASRYDFKSQLEELKEQFVRETGISRVLFSDPSVTLNSNQALMTSMKPTTDIALAKKSIWSPILRQMFIDMLETMAEYDETIKELINTDDDWDIQITWPDYSAKYDPAANSMLINRFNAGLISIQSYMEAMGEGKEEIDRISDEYTNAVTAAVLAHQTPLLAQQVIGQTQQQPGQAPATPGAPAQINTTANNTPGSGIISQPGSGATTTSPQGAVAQAAQAGGA